MSTKRAAVLLCGLLALCVSACGRPAPSNRGDPRYGPSKTDAIAVLTQYEHMVCPPVEIRIGPADGASDAPSAGARVLWRWVTSTLGDSSTYRLTSRKGQVSDYAYTADGYNYKVELNDETAGPGTARYMTVKTCLLEPTAITITGMPDGTSSAGAVDYTTPYKLTPIGALLKSQIDRASPDAVADRSQAVGAFSAAPGSFQAIFEQLDESGWQFNWGHDRPNSVDSLWATPARASFQ